MEYVGMRSGQPVEVRRLSDPDVTLTELIPARESIAIDAAATS